MRQGGVGGRDTERLARCARAMGRWDSPPRGGDISPLRRPAAADRERERDARAAPLPEHSPRVQQGGAGASAVAERPKQPEQRAAANKDDNAAPSFGLSGALAAEANAVAPGASATFAPPLEAAVPGQPWRYVPPKACSHA